VAAPSLAPAARSPFSRPGALAPRAPPVAPRSGLSPPGPAVRVPRRRASAYRPPRTAYASGPSPDRARADLAARPRRRRPPGPARGARLRRRAHGGRTRCPPPFWYPSTTAALPGLPTFGIRHGRAAATGGITKPGHRPARRALLAGAWASRDPAQVRRYGP